jgi:hypothetical protein
MKKIILLLSLLIIFITPSFAQCDYYNMCSKKAYDLSSKGYQITSTFTGMTFLAEKIAQAIIKKEIKKITNGRLKVKIKSYSVKDLINGRFKYLELSGKNLKIDNAYLTSFEAKTLCDFNYIQLNKNSIKFQENMLLGFKIVISDKDLKKTMKSSGYLDTINKIKLSAMGITFLKLEDADVQIKNNKLYFLIKFNSPMSTKPIPIVVQSDLKIEEGKIVINKIHFVNLFTMIDFTKITSLLNKLNPLNFSVNILKNDNSELNIKKVNIIADKIFIEGNIFIPQNVDK